MAAGDHIGNVTWKQIDIESCVIALSSNFGMENSFLASFLYLTSPTIKIQDGRLWPYWKCNFKVNGHRNPCNITFPTKCGIESPFLASFLYFDESKYKNSRWPPSTNSIFFSVLSHIIHIAYWISHEKLVFSNMCLFPGIISCILTSPNIKIQDGHQQPYWKFNSKENSPGNRYIITFPINYCTLNVKSKDGRHLSFPLFSDLSHSTHCSCWMSHQKLVSSNICWFYVLLLHIFPQWSPRKVEINNFWIWILTTSFKYTILSFGGML